MRQNSENQRKNDSENKNNNEHDKIFRTILTNKDEAANLINKALHLENGYKIKLEDIELYETQYITKKFQNRLADVVYIIKNKKLIKQGKVFIHIEHQTKQDKTMPYRMEEYAHEIKRMAMKDSHDGLIPKVYNIVVYSGEGNWKVKNKISTIESSLKAEVNEENQYEVIQLSSYSEEELDSEQIVLPKVLKIETKDKAKEIIEEMFKIDLNKITTERRELLIIYFNQVILKHISPENMELIEKLMNKEVFNMLAAERVFVRELKEQYNAGEIAGRKSGYNEGEIAGRKSGYSEGEIAGKRGIVKNLLKMEMDIEKISQATGLEPEEIEKIKIENG